MNDLADRLTAIEAKLVDIADRLADMRDRPLPRGRRRRRASRRAPRPLTARQAEVVAAVTRNGGVFAWAARDLGISRQLVAKTYAAAMKKLPGALSNARRGRPATGHAGPLPEDHRGAVILDHDACQRTLHAPT